MKKHYIYLAGNISTDIKTYEWRMKFERLVKERNLPVAVLNPCKNQFNEEMLKAMKHGLKDFFSKAGKMPLGVLPDKDYQMVKISTIIVSNFKYIHPKKPSIGTVAECIWARDLHIPVIAIVDESKKKSVQYLYSRHPFLDRCISERVNSVEEAVDIVEKFFVFTNGEDY